MFLNIPIPVNAAQRKASQGGAMDSIFAELVAGSTVGYFFTDFIDADKKRGNVSNAIGAYRRRTGDEQEFVQRVLFMDAGNNIVSADTPDAKQVIGLWKLDRKYTKRVRAPSVPTATPAAE
jgi:hypothetical protein